MLIPIGHEETSVRRLPWVSLAVVALCVLSWGLGRLETADESAIADHEQVALRYYFEHPYLELDQELQKFQYYQLRQMQDDRKAPQPPAAAQLAMEQAELDRLTGAVFAARDRIRFYRWGLVPSRIKARALISHQFLHADFLHLLFNMLFLYLVAPYIEDVWGRPIFATFYLLGGVVAGLGFALKYPALDEPLIGASGAVSAAMGAFLVRYWNTKITFFYTLGLRRWTGTFSAPAWIMLLLWVARELFYAQGAWVIMPGAAGNVAHWAHVYGFVFGVVVALGIKQLKVEERWVNRAIERRITVFEDRVVDEAVELARQGDPEQAFRDLQAELARHPDNDGAAVALWSVALAIGRCPEAAPRIVPLIRSAARTGDLEAVRAYWTDLIRAAPEVAVEPAVAVRVVEMLQSGSRLDEASESLEWLAPRLGPEVPLPLVVRLARIAHCLHLPEAQLLADLGRRHPRLTPEVADELARMTTETKPAPAPNPARPIAAAAAGPAPAATPALEVMAAVPLALEGDRLTVRMASGERRVRLEAMRALAVAAIESQPGQSFLLLDLFLDDPATAADRLRVLRLRSSDFDPRAVVGGDDAAAAMRTLVERLLAASSARPIPHREAVLDPASRRYASVDDYQRALLERRPGSATA